MIFIRRLIWDKWKVAHIARHNVTPAEVEEVCHGDPLEREGYNKRIVLLGPTKAGRILAIILEPLQENGLYYPVTAYESRKARRIYQQEKEGEKAA